MHHIFRTYSFVETIEYVEYERTVDIPQPHYKHFATSLDFRFFLSKCISELLALISLILVYVHKFSHALLAIHNFLHYPLLLTYH